MINYQNKKIQEKYQSDANFRKNTDEEEQRYHKLLNKSKEVFSQKSQETNILQPYPYEQNCDLYFWYGDLQPVPGKQSSKLTLQFLRTFRPKLDKPFIFVYFNNRTPSSDYFFEFKNIFLLLPLSIIQKMRNFIIVKASKYIKVLSFVDKVGNLLAESYLNVQNCKQLCQKLKLNIKEFVQFVPESISTEFPEILKRKPKLTNFRLNLKGQTCTLQQKKQKMQFQKAISGFLQKQIYSIQQYPISEVGIPMILEALITYFQNSPEGLQAQGIFRKSVGVDEQDQILSQLKRSEYSCLKDIKNPYMIACLIKKFFYNLKSPVIPYPHYNIMLSNPTLNNIKAVVDTLPKVNYLSLLYLLQFLSKDVMKHHQKNKMNAYNLAVCLSQALMRAQFASEASILNAKSTVNIAYEMINNLQFICKDVNKLFSKHLIQKVKKFEITIKTQLQIDLRSRLTKGNARQQKRIEMKQKYRNMQVINQEQQQAIQAIIHTDSLRQIQPLIQNHTLQSAKIQQDKVESNTNKLDTSPLVQKMLEINSYLKSIQERFKNKNKQNAVEQKQFKSFIFQDQELPNQECEDNKEFTYKRSNTFDSRPSNSDFVLQKKQ